MIGTEVYDAGQALSSVPVPAWLGASAVFGVFAVKAFDWWLSRRTTRAHEDQMVAAADGTTKLIEQLNARIAQLESRQADLERRLNEETMARFTAEESVSKMRLRIAALISVMRQHKLEIPEIPEL